MINKKEDKNKNIEISHRELQEYLETLDPKRNIQDIAASAAEILAHAQLSTKWDDVLPMLEDENIKEEFRLAAHIIFRAKLILEGMEKDPSSINLVYNTILMMDSLEIANLKGYLPSLSSVNFNKMESSTSSINIAVKKEMIIDTIRRLSKENPNKGITWLRKRASQLLSSGKKKGYSYRQILRDTKGMKLKK
tara:strand:+ start:17934 stop:18512 length:579 start_codon:yes stop_codon:yes gene_type:complete